MSKTQKIKMERLCQKRLTGEGFTLVCQPSGRNIHVAGDWKEVMRMGEALLRTLTPDAQKYQHEYLLVSDTRENPISSCWLGDIKRAALGSLDIVFSD